MAFHHFTKMATGGTMALGLVCAGTLRADVVEDFEDYTDSASLVSSTSGATANVTVELAANGINGGKSFKMTGANNLDPWWSMVKFDVSDFSLSGVDAVTFDAITLKNPGDLDCSIENLWVFLYDVDGNELAANKDLGTTRDYQDNLTTLSIDTSSIDGTVSQVGFLFDAVDYGQSIMLFDNFQTVTVPEPASMMLLGLTGLAFLGRKRRKH
ncbi:PEP-CTERM sorting domain-containing protein [Poriferisphaera sp. WC338]|uniref:PEP-CTERM sorting domain-containing protein n=1 Tax=Poriferisphaera sp. WC338 TaxID=3425129 RepID=UPI003D816918